MLLPGHSMVGHSSPRPAVVTTCARHGAYGMNRLLPNEARADSSLPVRGWDFTETLASSEFTSKPNPPQEEKGKASSGADL